MTAQSRSAPNTARLALGSARPTAQDKRDPIRHASSIDSKNHTDHLRWFWSMTVTGPMTRSDRVATLEEAKAQFQNSWDAWKAERLNFFP